MEGQGQGDGATGDAGRRANDGRYGDGPTEKGPTKFAAVLSLLPPALTNYFTIRHSDVSSFTIRAFGRAWPVQDFMGRIMLQDVGKRVYLRGGVLQVENHEQFAARLADEHAAAEEGFTNTCECEEHVCPLTLNTGKHPAGDVCGLPGEMHLFPLQRGNEPTVFCERCGDDAILGGLYASGEDVQIARRKAEGWKEGSVPCGYCGLPVNDSKVCGNCFRVLTTGKPERPERKISRKGQGGTGQSPPMGPAGTTWPWQ